MSDEDNTYLIWSHEHSMWWGPGECGYTRRISKAGRYLQADALRICVRAMPGNSTDLRALPELPVRVSDVERMATEYRLHYPGRTEEWE